MKQRIISKGLTVAVISLFVGVGIQPVFAELHLETYNSEFVELTVSIFKTNEIRQHTLMLTQEKVDELNSQFDNFKVKLDKTISKKETVEIYNDMIFLIYEFGLLLGYMSAYEAQQLITGRNHLVSGNELLSKLFDNSNFFCLISGEVHNSGFPLEYWILPLFFIPFKIGGIMYIGTYMQSAYGQTYNYNNGYGWVKTRGLLGQKEWNGVFNGAIIDFMIIGNPMVFWIMGHYSVVGFTGISIKTEFGDNIFFVGFAAWVKIKNI